MKFLAAFVLSALTITGFSGCETELPQRNPSPAEKLQRGVTGHGSLFIPGQDPSTTGR